MNGLLGMKIGDEVVYPMRGRRDPAIGAVAIMVAIALRVNERRPDNHGLELPSGEAAAWNEASRTASCLTFGAWWLVNFDRGG